VRLCDFCLEQCVYCPQKDDDNPLGMTLEMAEGAEAAAVAPDIQTPGTEGCGRPSDTSVDEVALQLVASTLSDSEAVVPSTALRFVGADYKSLASVLRLQPAFHHSTAFGGRAAIGDDCTTYTPGSSSIRPDDGVKDLSRKSGSFITRLLFRDKKEAFQVNENRINVPMVSRGTEGKGGNTNTGGNTNAELGLTDLPPGILRVVLEFLAKVTLHKTLVGGKGSGRINSCCFSPDGKTILSGSSFNWALRMYDVATQKLLCSFASGQTPIADCCFAPPHGNFILSCCSSHRDKTIKVWDTRTSSLVSTVFTSTVPISTCALTPDGKTVVGSCGNSVQVWDASTTALGKIKHDSGGTGPTQVMQADGAVKACCSSPDGTQILSGSGSDLILWDLHTGCRLRTLRGHARVILGCSFSPDGAQMASCSKDKTLKLWRVDTGHLDHTLSSHTEWVTGCAYSPDGALVLSCSDDLTLKLWSPTTGQVQRTFATQSYCWACSFHPDGRTLLSGHEDGTLKLWA
jgi:hypothetical protein